MPQSSERSPAHRDTEQHAAEIADAVAIAWNKSDHSGRRDVALSVVAALSMAEQRDLNGPDLAEQLRSQSTEEFTRTLRQIYTALVNARPDLTHLVYPLMHWVFNEPDTALQRAAKHTADAALRAGQLDLTTTDNRYDVDLLGVVLTLLKSENATGASAQIYTSTSIADAMNYLLMANLNPACEGQNVMDPAVGTGGLFRAAAKVMRNNGQNPTTASWYGADIDDLAIAACAVNSLLWKLGPRILLCVANTLTEGNWAARAEAQRTEILRISGAVRRDKRMLDATRSAQRLIEVSTVEEHTDPDTSAAP